MEIKVIKSRCRFDFLTSYPLSRNSPPPTLLFGLLRLDSLLQQPSSNRRRQKQMNKAITRLLQRTSLFFFFFFFFFFCSLFRIPKQTANHSIYNTYPKNPHACNEPPRPQPLPPPRKTTQVQILLSGPSPKGCPEAEGGVSRVDKFGEGCETQIAI